MPKPGGTYAPKVDDHMKNVIDKPCPRCGAKVNELCLLASGKRATKVQDVHTARFRKTKILADHTAAI